MNAHSPVWGSAYVRGHGSLIENILEEYDLTVINAGQPTLITPPSGSKSIIDLVICSPNLYYNLDLSVLDDTFGSDHYPILVKHLQLHPYSSPTKNSESALSNAYNWKSLTPDTTALPPIFLPEIEVSQLII